MPGQLKAKVGGSWVPVAGGAPTDEVYIGSADPGMGTTHELWFDSDATSPADTSRWNSAWGIIATGSFPAPLAPHAMPTVGTLTNPLTATLITGRRYRLFLQARAVNPMAGATSVSFFIRDNGVDYRSWTGGGDPYVYAAGNYSTAAFEWLFTGDNTSHSFEIRVDPGIGANIFTDYGLYYLEDVGPISYGIPPATDPTPTAVAWTPLPLLNNWTWAGGSYPPPVYRKVGDMVQVRGGVANATPLVNPSVVNFALLPVGFRPLYNCNMPAIGIGTDSWGCASLMTVLNSGHLQAVRNAGPSTQPHILTQFDVQFSVTP